MNAQEKARELVDRFLNANYTDISLHGAKQCAFIAVDLHLNELSKMKLIFSDRQIHNKLWQEVRQEIEKL